MNGPENGKTKSGREVLAQSGRRFNLFVQSAEGVDRAFDRSAAAARVRRAYFVRHPSGSSTNTSK